MSYDINTILSDCYEGTSCLVNKYGIQDEKKFSAIEYKITLFNISELEKNPIQGNFDTAHYKAVHKYLFDDLYDWAGCFRKVNISKNGTRFADFKNLEKLCENCVSRIKNFDYFKNFGYDEFVDNIVDLYCTLNYLHPFREGNGRTQRVFISQLVRFCGYDINFSDIDKDLLMIATIQAAHGVTDNLKMIFYKSIIQ